MNCVTVSALIIAWDSAGGRLPLHCLRLLARASTRREAGILANETAHELVETHSVRRVNFGPLRPLRYWKGPTLLSWFWIILMGGLLGPHRAGSVTVCRSVTEVDTPSESNNYPALWNLAAAYFNQDVDVLISAILTR